MDANDDLLFRLLLSSLSLVLAGLWCWSFFKGGVDTKSLFTVKEGVLVGVLLRILLTVSMVSIFVYVLQPESMGWSRIPFPPWARFLGVPLCAVALILFGSAGRSLGAGFSPTLRIRPGQRLATTGPYRIVRHPMYVAFLVSSIGYGLLSANWFIGATGIGAECIIIFFRTPREEQMLIEGFGKNYIDYVQRTARFFPRWRDLLSRPRIR